MWVWEYKNEDDEVHDMFMDTDEEIRFCVTNETFVDTVPNSDQPPSMVGGAEAAVPEKKQIPYTITVSMLVFHCNKGILKAFQKGLVMSLMCCSSMAL